MDVEERLVDREPLDDRRGILEDAEDRLARLHIRGEPRRDDDRVRAETARDRAAHRGADAECLRLVARGEDDSGADDDRAAEQPRLVTLLDRGEERVEIGMEDRSAAN